MTMPTNAEPRVRIDWYNDGQYTDAIDDVTPLVMGQPGLTVEWGRDTARSTSPPMVGAADCELLNEDRALSPENPSSPRYQFVVPGRPIQIDVLHGTERLYRADDLYRADVYYRGVGVIPLLAGHTDEFGQNAEWGHRVVSMSALSRAARLLRKRISVPFSGATRTDTAAAAILDAAGWPTADRLLHVSDAVMNGYWVDERPAWDCLVELLATEGAGAVFYVDGFGTFIWLNRNHRTVQPRSVTSQATLHDGTSSGFFYTHLSYDPRWDDIVNRVTVSTKQRLLAGAPTVIWQLGTDYSIAAATSATVWARPQDPFQNAIAPVDGVDYTVTGGTVFVGLAWQSGAVAAINVTGITGTPTIHNLQLRAYSYPVIGETVIEAIGDTVSDPEEKTLNLAAWPQLDPNQAQAIADSYLARYSTSRPIITVVMQNADGPTMEKILDLQISDRVTVINQHLGINVDCWVERIRHQLTVGGRHELTLFCEPVAAIGSTGGVWDSSLWDTGLWGI
jgi:hypothetical protein